MKCKICNQPALNNLLVYENMPSVAQNLPDKNCLQSDIGVDLRVCQCGYCGTIQLDNEPVLYYREVIRATGISEEMRTFRSRQFSDFVNRFGLHGKKIIEIGCGSGENLPVMENCGADSYGLEYSEKSVRNANAAGLKVFQGFIDCADRKICDTVFDGFYTLNYLEHLPNPPETMRGVYNNLSDGAYGIVEVPNMDMFLKNGLFYDFMLDHLFYFTKNTLSTLLQLSGFDVLCCQDVWHDYIISAVVRKRKPVDLSHFEKHRETLITQIDNHLAGCAHGTTAVWGAGHQALFILAMLKNAGRIKYVVDSAEFKQGRYTPVSHIPIVAPNNIKNDPVVNIIVMAGSYSDEVAGSIMERFGEEMKISILRDYGLETVKKTKN